VHNKLHPEQFYVTQFWTGLFWVFDPQDKPILIGQLKAKETGEN